MNTDAIKGQVLDLFRFKAGKLLVTTKLLNDLRLCDEGIEKFNSIFGHETTMTAYKLRRFGKFLDIESFSYAILTGDAYSICCRTFAADEKQKKFAADLVDHRLIARAQAARKKGAMESVVLYYSRLAAKWHRQRNRVWSEALINVLGLDNENNETGETNKEISRNSRIRSSRRAKPRDESDGSQLSCL